MCSVVTTRLVLPRTFLLTISTHTITRRNTGMLINHVDRWLIPRFFPGLCSHRAPQFAISILPRSSMASCWSTVAVVTTSPTIMPVTFVFRPVFSLTTSHVISGEHWTIQCFRIFTKNRYWEDMATLVLSTKIHSTCLVDSTEWCITVWWSTRREIVPTLSRLKSATRFELAPSVCGIRTNVLVMLSRRSNHRVVRRFDQTMLISVASRILVHHVCRTRTTVCGVVIVVLTTSVGQSFTKTLQWWPPTRRLSRMFECANQPIHWHLSVTNCTIVIRVTQNHTAPGNETASVPLCLSTRSCLRIEPQRILWLTKTESTANLPATLGLPVRIAPKVHACGVTHRRDALNRTHTRLSIRLANAWNGLHIPSSVRWWPVPTFSPVTSV